jgi:sporulation protein YlmC with PRC-barrel domain
MDGDVIVDFWLEKDNQKITSGYDTIYFSGTGEKTETTQLFLPSTASDGVYDFYVQATYENYTASAKRTVEVVYPEIILKEEEKLEDFEEEEPSATSFFVYLEKNKNYFIMGFGVIVLILLVIILIKLFRKKITEPKNKKHLNKKIETVELKLKHLKSLKKHKAIKYPSYHLKKEKLLQRMASLLKKRSLIVIVLGTIIFLGFINTNMTGFVSGDSAGSVTNFKRIIYFILIITLLGVLGFIYRKKIQDTIEDKKRRKYPKNSVKGSIKKRVYTQDGEYFGKVEEAILKQNKIYGFKIKLSKSFKKEIANKGIIIKYKHVRNVGHIVIIDDKISKHIKNN